MDGGGGGEGRARVPPTSRFTVERKKERNFSLFFSRSIHIYSQCYSQLDVGGAAEQHTHTHGAVTDSPHRFGALCMQQHLTGGHHLPPFLLSSSSSSGSFVHPFYPHIFNITYSYLQRPFFSPPFDFGIKSSTYDLTFTMK